MGGSTMSPSKWPDSKVLDNSRPLSTSPGHTRSSLRAGSSRPFERSEIMKEASITGFVPAPRVVLGGQMATSSRWRWDEIEAERTADVPGASATELRAGVGVRGLGRFPGALPCSRLLRAMLLLAPLMVVGGGYRSQVHSAEPEHGAKVLHSQPPEHDAGGGYGYQRRRPWRVSHGLCLRLSAAIDSTDAAIGRV